MEYALITFFVWRVSATHYNHRGVLQLALGEDARANNEGFKFDKAAKLWVVTFEDIIDYNTNLTEEDIDEDFIQALLENSIENGNELKCDSYSRGSGGAGGGFGG
jgi:hypothetical protein